MSMVDTTIYIAKIIIIIIIIIVIMIIMVYLTDP